MKSTNLIPITKLITIPEGIAISPEQLEVAALSDLPRLVVLVTKLGPVKVLISRNGTLSVRLYRKVRPDDPLAAIYGVKKVAKTMANATCFVPMDEEEAKLLPDVRSASWKLPDEVDWWFDLPVTTTGAQLLSAVRISDAFVMQTTEQLLAEPSTN